MGRQQTVGLRIIGTMTKAVAGFATPEGTSAYRNRFVDIRVGARHASPLHLDHFRERERLWFSSIGIGSYLGEPDEETDKLYESALKEALLSGVNVVDSAINYRCQRSERSFGKAIGELIQSGKLKREEIIICTKGGFLSFDGDYPPDPASYLRETYFKTGLLKPEDVAGGCHAMSPAYLEDQLGRSLANLGAETIDIYYLHNPEAQLAEYDREEFKKRLALAFGWAERKVKEGKIRMYGAATWNGYRVPAENDDYLSLEEMTLIAREAAGPEHHFKAVQLPFNLAMPEAWGLANQRFGGSLVPLLGVAERLGIIVIGSASLLQARLAGRLPPSFTEYFTKLTKPAQCALQFARSVPGMTTSLVGMKRGEHVRENIETAKIPRLTADELFQLFQQTE